MTRNFLAQSMLPEWFVILVKGQTPVVVYQRTEIALKMKPLIEEKAKQNHVANAGDKTSTAARQNSATPIEKIRTDSTVADLAGVSRDTVRKVEKIQQQAAPRRKNKMQESCKFTKPRHVNGSRGDKLGQIGPESAGRSCYAVTSGAWRAS